MKFRVKEKRIGRVLPIGGVLRAVVEDFNYDESFTILKLRDMWCEIVGAMIATHSTPDRMYKDVLYIAVDHPVYSNEIMLMCTLIKERVDKRFGFEIFKRIKVEVKRIRWTKQKQE